MHNPIHITRIFRADRMRRERAMRRVVVQPKDFDEHRKACRALDVDFAVFLLIGLVAYVAFWLEIFGFL